MASLALLVRRSLRLHRRSGLGLVLVIVLAGGVALTALAGARRTASSFSRYLAESKASAVALNVVATSAAGRGSSLGADQPTTVLGIAQRARHLPGVVGDASYIGLESVAVVDDHGGFSDTQAEVLGSLDGRFIRQDRVALERGRLPQPSAVDEVFVNRRLARGLHVGPGSTVHLAVYKLLDLKGDPSQVDPQARVDVRVVGIGQFPDEVLGDDVDGTGRMLTTPAFTSRYRQVAGSYIWQGLRLARDTRVDDVIAAYETLLPADTQINVQRTDVELARVQRSVRPVVVALTAFGIASGLAALVLGALGMLRLVGAASGDARTFRALGLHPQRIALAVAAPALVAAFVGAVGAAALAWVLSPVAPVGPVRAVEPIRGSDLDVTVLLVGSLVAGVVLAVVALLAARQNVARSRAAAPIAPRPSWLVGRFAAIGMGPAAVIGARHALGGDGPRSGAPSRSALAACTISVVAIASALTFGASVRSLLDTPAHYGWNASAAVQSGGGYDRLDVTRAHEAAAVPGVDGLTLASFAPIAVGRARVNAIGIEPIEGAPALTLVRGRRPTSTTEVALGASTARDLRVGIGDTIAAARGKLQITGIVALPAIGPLASAHPSLGQGALLTSAGLVAQAESAYPSLAFVHLRPGPGASLSGTAGGIDPSRGGGQAVGRVFSLLTHHPAEATEAYALLRPAEVVGLQPASRTANLLAGLLGGAAVLALALTLGASVRRRSGTYAVLSSLGFDRGDIRATVRWQTNVVTLLAVVLGIPLGVVAGRLAWTSFAGELGAAGGPRVPVALLALAVAALIVVSNTIGEGPARAASHASPRSLDRRA